MNLREMEIFRAIVRGGSITEAARILGVSQPAVSTALRHAEDKLGMQLFRRANGRIDPTPEALNLYPEVEALFQKYRAIQEYAADLKGANSGLLSVASTPTLSYVYLAPAVSRFKQEHPKVRVAVDVSHTPNIMEMARTGQIDLGVVADSSQATGLKIQPMKDMELVATMRKDHPLAEFDTVSPADLRGYPIITNTHHALFHEIEQAFHSRGLNVDVSVAINHNITTCLLLTDREHVALVDPWLPINLFPNLARKPFRPKIGIAARVVWSEGRPRSQLAKRFASFIIDPPN